MIIENFTTPIYFENIQNGDTFEIGGVLHLKVCGSDDFNEVNLQSGLLGHIGLRDIVRKVNAKVVVSHEVELE